MKEAKRNPRRATNTIPLLVTVAPSASDALSGQTEADVLTISRVSAVPWDGGTAYFSFLCMFELEETLPGEPLSTYSNTDWNLPWLAN